MRSNSSIKHSFCKPKNIKPGPYDFLLLKFNIPIAKTENIHIQAKGSS